MQRILGELPPDALLLLRRMFLDKPIGREEMNDLPSYGDLKLIRSKEAFPYYFRYVKDKAEEK